MTRTWYLNIGAAFLLAVGFGALFFSAANDSYAAPTLVANGTFDTDIANWTEVVGADADLAWDGAVDLNSDTNSGSGLLTYTGTGTGTAEVISACFDLTDTPVVDDAYPYEAAARPGTQWTTTDSTVDIDFVLWDTAACAGTSTTVSHGATTIGNAGGGWVVLSGTVTVLEASTWKASMQVVLRVNAEVPNDAAWWDEVKLAEEELDTPTPTSSPTSTNTAATTNTPAATNTPAPTNTPEPTQTEVPTDTAIPTNTAVPATNTPVPPTATNTTAAPPPASELEDTQDTIGGQIADSGTGAGGEVPEGDAAAGGEQPEGSEFPESGTGPGSYGSERSGTADVIATFAFALAISMLGAGFHLRRKYETQQ